MCVCIWGEGQLKALRFCWVNIVFGQPHVLHRLLKRPQEFTSVCYSWLFYVFTRKLSLYKLHPLNLQCRGHSKSQWHSKPHHTNTLISALQQSTASRFHFTFQRQKNITLIVPDLILNLNWKWRETTSLGQLDQIFPLKTPHVCSHIENLLKVWTLLTQII